MATGSEEKSKEGCEGVKRKKKLGTGFLPQNLGHPSQDLVVRKLVGERRRWLGGEKIREGHRKNNYLFLPSFPSGGTPAPHVRGPCVLQLGGPSPLSPVPAPKPCLPPSAEAGCLGTALGPQLRTLLLHKSANWLQVLEAPTPQSQSRDGETFPPACPFGPSIASFPRLCPSVMFSFWGS